MKRFEITYKNSLIMFGDNVFTRVFEGETPERALTEFSLKRGYVGMLSMISYKEVAE